MSQDGKDKKGELSSFAYLSRGCMFEQSMGMYRDVYVFPFYGHANVDNLCSGYIAVCCLCRGKSAHMYPSTSIRRRSQIPRPLCSGEASMG